MPLHPHLHILIPASTAGVHLEARLYLPSSAHAALAAAGTPLSTAASGSDPTPLADLPEPARSAVTQLALARVVTAAHPWARLGGNMLFPCVAANPGDRRVG